MSATVLVDRNRHYFIATASDATQSDICNRLRRRKTEERKCRIKIHFFSLAFFHCAILSVLRSISTIDLVKRV